MNDLTKMNTEELTREKTELRAGYEAFREKNLALDMTRGKPCPEQLDLSLEMLNCVNANIFKAENGTDCRNYGGLDDIVEAKELFAKMLEVDPAELVIGGNSSLNIMYDTFSRAMLFGVCDSDTAWGRLPAVKFICPTPGYDRHFSLCEKFNIEMIAVPMTGSGPDMDMVESLVKEDDAIKGIWCVPKYSNPTGETYSDETVKRLARMETKAGDFRVFWDNAYTVHHLTDEPDILLNMLSACKEAGNPNRVLIFGSTSKVTFAGAGVGMVAGSIENIDWVKKNVFFQTIGPDKLNHLRHVKFLKNNDGISDLMKKHAEIIRPKFDVVQDVLEKELQGAGIAEWTRPRGGYFVSLDTLDGCAARVISMAGNVGVKLTPAGSTFPCKQDLKDTNIRIAPTFPPTADVQSAMEVVVLCIKLVSVEKLLNQA